MNTALFTYAHYEPGKVYGEKKFTVDEKALAKWRSVYPEDLESDSIPGGMLAMIIVDAVLALNSPRPPGGVHAGQSFDVRRMPRPNEILITEVRCLDKEERNGRKWVRTQTITRSEAGEVLVTGIMTTLVAL